MQGEGSTWIVLSQIHSLVERECERMGKIEGKWGDKGVMRGLEYVRGMQGSVRDV